MDAEDLEIDDLVLALDGDYGVVEATLTEARTQTMYDLDVAIVDTFAVGDGAWVVHNCGGSSPTIRQQRDAAFAANVGNFRRQGFTVPGGAPTFDDLNIVSQLMRSDPSHSPTSTISLLWHYETNTTFVGRSGLNPAIGEATVFGGSGWPALVHAEADSLHQLYRHVGAGSKNWADVPPGIAGDAYMFVDLPACTYCLPGKSLFGLDRFGLPKTGNRGVFGIAADEIRLNSLTIDTLYYSLTLSGSPSSIRNISLNSRLRHFPPPYSTR